MKKFIWTVLAATFAFSSCVDETEIDRKPNPNGRQVMFSESVSDYESRSTRAMDGHPIENVPGQANKGLIPVGKSFGVWAWVHDADDDEVVPTKFAGLQNKEVTRGTKDGKATYTYTPVAIWPDPDEQTLSFVAIYPYFGSADAAANGNYPRNSQSQTMTFNSPGEVYHGLSGMSFHYQVPIEGEKHIDIMYAHYGATSGYDPVELEFHHALARVRFSALIDGFEPGAEVQVTGIKLKNAMLHGMFNVYDDPSFDNNPAWQPRWSEVYADPKGDISVADGTGGRPNHIVADVDTADGIDGLTGMMHPVTTSTSATSTAGDLLIIPQEAKSLSLEITTTVDGEAGKTYLIPLAAAPALKMNEIHNYRIVLTPEEGSVDVVVVPWDDSFDEDYEFDGQNRLRVDKGEVTFDGTSTSATVGIYTDYEKSTTDKGWEIELEDEFDWFTVNKTSGEPGSNPDILENVTITLAAGVNIHSLREGWFTVVAGNMHKRVYVTHDSGFEYIMAPPGVLGIKRSEFNKPLKERSLTLRGSSTYKNVNQPFVTDKEFGELEDEPVYTVNFMWGSMVAMVGVYDKTWSGDDIAWVNSEFDNPSSFEAKFNTTSAANTSSASGVNNVIENPLLGHGDPCKYALHHNDEQGGYLTPTGDPWQFSDGTKPFGDTNMALDDAEAAGIAVWTDQIPMGLTPSAGVLLLGGKIFLPSSNGNAASMWTSTYSFPVSLNLANNTMHITTNMLKSSTVLVRCVPEPPVPDPSYVLAPPGVIGIKMSEYDRLMALREEIGDPTYLPSPDSEDYPELTIKGSSTYKGTAFETSTGGRYGTLEKEPVYAVYFKWSSMVAMIGTNGDTIDASDVVWVNPDYDRVAYPITSYGSISPAYFTNPMTGSGVALEALDRGHGDACRFLYGATQDARAGWRTPTYDELITFTGTTRIPSSPTISVDSFYIWANNDGTPANPGVATFVRGSDAPSILPAAGFINPTNSTVELQGTYGRYWSSSVRANVGNDPFRSSGGQIIFQTPVNFMSIIVSVEMTTGAIVRCIAG